MIFVAVNKIFCVASYRERFEANFKSRARAIDERPGFLGLEILRPHNENEPYLIMSRWESEAAFLDWTKSEEFKQAHKRAHTEMQAFTDRGDFPPLKSSLSTYEILA